MDLSPTTTTRTVDRDKLWLASQHGTDSTDSCTLDIAGGTFAAVLQEGGTVVPSGTPIVKGGDGLYDRATGAAVADGHLFEDVIIKPTTTRAGGALHWHGEVVQAQVPGGMTDANRARLVRYV